MYKGKAVKLIDLSKELGVQYVLKGSVRQADGQVRITAQLIDATQDRHVWAERYDRPLKEIFAAEDEIVKKIVTTLKLQLTLQRARDISKESHREFRGVYMPSCKRSATAYRAYYEMKKSTGVQARQLIEHAIKLDPHLCASLCLLGNDLLPESGSMAGPQIVLRRWRKSGRVSTEGINIE